MQICAVQLCCGLRKYDHVTEFYHRLQWLPSPYLSYCTTSNINLDAFYLILQFALVKFCIIYCTTTPTYFANIPMLCLSYAQSFFHYKTMQWWNTLPLSVTSSINSPFYEYVDGLRQYYDSLFD